MPGGHEHAIARRHARCAEGQREGRAGVGHGSRAVVAERGRQRDARAQQEVPRQARDEPDGRPAAHQFGKSPGSVSSMLKRCMLAPAATARRGTS